MKQFILCPYDQNNMQKSDSHFTPLSRHAQGKSVDLLDRGLLVWPTEPLR